MALMQYCDIKARCEENIIRVKSQPRVGFGQYKGMQYSDLPDSYMIWLKTNYRGYDRELVEAELKKEVYNSLGLIIFSGTTHSLNCSSVTSSNSNAASSKVEPSL